MKKSIWDIFYAFHEKRCLYYVHKVETTCGKNRKKYIDKEAKELVKALKYFIKSIDHFKKRHPL